jgi:putative tricarboxylic transport membrane protein
MHPDFLLGLATAVTPENLLFCLVGALLGTLIGVLPGLAPSATMAMLLPATFYFPPTGALIMLAGIYYGAQYGGSTTSILLKMPGENSSIVTCLDGHAMARNGRAGAALAIAALASFFAGSVATVLIAVAAPLLNAAARSFGPAEYFSLMVFGLVTAILLSQGSVLRSAAMILAGLLLAVVGTDVTTGIQRFTFGQPQLLDGIGFVPLAMGLFAVAEIIGNLEKPEQRGVIQPMSSLWPTREEFRQAAPAAVRGTFVGSLLGVLPGGGALIASFAAYGLEKRISRTPERFGNGAVEGLASPEAANNAGAQTSFIPLLTLGIPSNPVMAMMAGAMMIQGVTPGPQFAIEKPEIFWAVIVSMWLGNLMLLVINLPLVGIWVKMIRIPYRLFYPCILFICCIGVFSVNNSMFDVMTMLGFGVTGHVLTKFGCEPAPLVLAYILGSLMEEYFQRALFIARGDPMVFVERPISAVCLALAAALAVAILTTRFRRPDTTSIFQGSTS